MPSSRQWSRPAAVVLAGLLVSGIAPLHAAAETGAQQSARALASAPAPGAAPGEHRVWVKEMRKLVVAHAKSRQGSAYVWGGSGPTQFDCSGLVMWVYQQLGIELPHYSGAQMDVATPVARERLRRGDLLFYGPDGSRHVAIYIGKGLQLGANNPRTGIVVDAIDGGYWAGSYAGAGRLIR